MRAGMWLGTLVIVAVVMCETVSARADDMEQVRKGALMNMIIAMKNTLVITEHRIKECEAETAARKKLQCFEGIQLQDKFSMMNEVVTALIEEMNRNAGRRN